MAGIEEGMTDRQIADRLGEVLIGAEHLRQAIGTEDWVSIHRLGNGNLEIALHFQNWENIRGYDLLWRSLKLIYRVFASRWWATWEVKR